MTQRMMKSGRYSPVVASAYVITVGTLILAIWVIATEGLPPINLSARTWTNVLLLGFLATTLTTFLWNWGLARVAASQAGVFIIWTSVVGTILGVILLNDVLGSFAIVGGLLVIGAAIFVAAK